MNEFKTLKFDRCGTREMSTFSRSPGLTFHCRHSMRIGLSFDIECEFVENAWGRTTFESDARKMIKLVYGWEECDE